jgi:TolB-like protein
MLDALLQRGRIRDADEHAAATIRSWQEEGLDWSGLRAAWQAARNNPRGPAVAQVEPPPRAPLESRRRASIAVMPFVDRSATAGIAGGPADGLAHDLITRLAKLRSLFVIAEGSVFALRDRHIAPEEAGRMLNVDYVVSGSLQRRGERLTVTVELAETRTARIVWAAAFDRQTDGAFLVLDEIGNGSRLGRLRIRRSSATAPSCGHQLTRRLRRTTAALACTGSAVPTTSGQYFFERGAARPLSRAYAGLSFAFQDAFQNWARRSGDRSRLRCRRTKPDGRDRDPAAHWAMGRALGCAAVTTIVLGLQNAIDQAQLCAWLLYDGFRPVLSGIPRPPSPPPTIRASSRRSTRCCSAYSARAPWR